MLSLLVAAAGLLSMVTAVPSPSKTASAPQETCSSIVVDSITIEDATLVCCSNLALSVDNIATGVGTGCTFSLPSLLLRGHSRLHDCNVQLTYNSFAKGVQADYSKYATKGDCAGKPAIAACCDIPVSPLTLSCKSLVHARLADSDTCSCRWGLLSEHWVDSSSNARMLRPHSIGSCGCEYGLGKLEKMGKSG